MSAAFLLKKKKYYKKSSAVLFCVFSYGKINLFYGILFKLLLFALHTECISFSLWKDFSCIAPERAHTHIRAHAYRAQHKRKKENTNGGQTIMPSCSIRKIMFYKSLTIHFCVRLRVRKISFSLNKRRTSEMEVDTKRVVKSKATTTVDGWRADGLALIWNNTNKSLTTVSADKCVCCCCYCCVFGLIPTLLSFRYHFLL